MTPEQIASVRKQLGISDEGVDAPVNSPVANVARRRQLAADADAKKEKSKGFVSETIGDIGQTVKNIGQTARETVQKVGNIDTARNTGDQGLLRSFGQTVGAVGGGVSKALGDVVIGAGKAVLPESAEQGIEEAVSDTVPKLVELDQRIGAPISKMVEKYNSLDEKTKRDLDAVLGIGSIAADISGLGALGKVTTAATKTAGTQLAKTATRLGEIGAETARRTSQAATQIKPVLEGAQELAAGAKRSISNIPTKMATNVAEKRSVIQQIESLPTETARRTASLGVEPADVQTLLNIPAKQKPMVKELVDSVKAFSNGTSKVRPEEVVGKPLTSALQKLEAKRLDVGQKLGRIADDLGEVTVDEVYEPVLKRLREVTGLKGLKVNEEGVLDFSDTTLATALSKSDRNAIAEIFEAAIEPGTGKSKHLLRQELFEILGGKKSSLQNLTDTQEKAYEAVRQGLADVLDAKNGAYRATNAEYAKIIAPMKDLRKMLKSSGIVDEDILDMAAGLLARRLTSNAPSNPQLRQILKNVSNLVGDVDLENMQDIYNILDKYYDIAAKTGFQGQVKSAVEKSGSGLVDRISGAVQSLAGETPAVRTKAIEDLFDEILGFNTPAVGQTADDLGIIINKLRDEALPAKQYIDDLADEISDITNSKVSKTEIKSFESAMRKVQKEYNGSTNRLTDLARNTIVSDTYDDVDKVVDMLKQKADIVDYKHVKPDVDALGYSGRLIKVRTPNGTVAEIQVNTPDMIFAKESEESARNILGDSVYDGLTKRYNSANVKGGQGHVLYEKWRVLDETTQQAKDLAEKSKKYYKNFI